jgi:hypothetical protein
VKRWDVQEIEAGFTRLSMPPTNAGKIEKGELSSRLLSCLLSCLLAFLLPRRPIVLLLLFCALAVTHCILLSLAIILLLLYTCSFAFCSRVTYKHAPFFTGVFLKYLSSKFPTFSEPFLDRLFVVLVI